MIKWDYYFRKEEPHIVHVYYIQYQSNDKYITGGTSTCYSLNKNRSDSMRVHSFGHAHIDCFKDDFDTLEECLRSLKERHKIKMGTEAVMNRITLLHISQ